jgi:hypothetical protein
MVGVDGDADVLSLEKGAGLRATMETKRKLFSQELEQTKKKKAVLVSAKLVKRKLLKVYNTN